MKLYEVFNPELDTNVRFKVLNEQETYKLVNQYKHSSQDDFMRAVIESVVFNLKTDVSIALKKIPKDHAHEVLATLFNCSLMLNPGLDVLSWLQIANSPQVISNYAASPANIKKPSPRTSKKRPPTNKISRAKFLNLERHLKESVIGQDEAIDELIQALKRSHVGLNDEERPLGVFIFAGASGVGKSLIAKELHKYLFDNDEMVRVDCGEYQHKHENQKLIGSPPGYLGHDEGGQLTNALLKNPNTVVLLDEVEKADPDLWNTFLRVFDEGWLTDNSGKKVSFHNAIIIMTTNLGNKKIVDDTQVAKIGFHSSNVDNKVMRDRVIRVTKDAIQKYFRPEFLNRIDKIVVFNHLNHEDLKKIAELELHTVQSKLDKKGFIITYEDAVVEAMISDGVDSTKGARGLSQVRRDKIENLLATSMMSKRHAKGTVFKLDFNADEYQIKVQSPTIKRNIVVTTDENDDIPESIFPI